MTNRFSGSFLALRVKSGALSLSASLFGSDQIARVLKARDGSLESGNRFYEFLKTGEGDNPLQSLLIR